MKDSQIEIVKQAIKEHGDDFWKEGNEHLFDDILEYIHKAGYDL